MHSEEETHTKLTFDELLDLELMGFSQEEQEEVGDNQDGQETGNTGGIDFSISPWEALKKESPVEESAPDPELKTFLPPWVKPMQVQGEGEPGKGSQEEIRSGVPSPLIATIEKSFEILDKEITELEIKDITILKNDKEGYAEPTGSELPIVLKSPDGYCCIEGVQYIRDAEAKQQTKVKCEILSVKEISPVGLAIWHYSIRQKTRGGVARYMEKVKAAAECKKLFLEMYDHIRLPQQGGARRGLNRDLWVFRQDEFSEGLPAKTLCEAIDGDLNPSAKITSPGIERLNELLAIPDLFDNLSKKYPNVVPTNEINVMVKRTKDYRKLGSYSQLNIDGQGNINKLNRLAIELFYTHLAPRSVINQEDDLVSLMAKQSENTRETVLKHLSDGEYLTENALDVLIAANAPRSFFDATRNKKRKAIDAMREDEDIDDEYISNIMSENILKAFSAAQKKSPVGEFQMLSEDEVGEAGKAAQHLFESLFPSESDEEEKDSEGSSIITPPLEQNVDITPMGSLQIKDQLLAAAEDLKKLADGAPSPEQVSADLATIMATLRKLRDDINAALLDTKKGV